MSCTRPDILRGQLLQCSQTVGTTDWSWQDITMPPAIWIHLVHLADAPPKASLASRCSTCSPSLWVRQGCIFVLSSRQAIARTGTVELFVLDRVLRRSSRCRRSPCKRLDLSLHRSILNVMISHRDMGTSTGCCVYYNVEVL